MTYVDPWDHENQPLDDDVETFNEYVERAERERATAVLS